MAIPLFKEQRITLRRRLSGLMPGRLVVKDTGKDLLCKPVDISGHGLGIVMAEQLEEGTKVLLFLNDKTVELEIIWRRPDFGKRDLYRYGLVSGRQDVDLESVFLSSGCLK